MFAKKIYGIITTIIAVSLLSACTFQTPLAGGEVYIQTTSPNNIYPQTAISEPTYVQTITAQSPTPPFSQPRIITPGTITFQIDERTLTLDTKNIDGFNYLTADNIQYALGINPGVFAGYYVEGTQYFRISEITRHYNFRTNWIETRSTMIIDTSNNYLVGEPIFKSEPLPYYIIDLIQGVSFHDNDRFGHDFLRYLTVTHVDFEGMYRTGNLIVAAHIADEVLDIFREIYAHRFPIERIRLIDYYSADDYLSMADNNSVAFNFRYIAGTTRLSNHAFGRAIDINPIQNPYYRNGTVWPQSGEPYLNRSYIRPGMIIPGGPVYNAFKSRGWIWGGDWTSPRDYHHFERRG